MTYRITISSLCSCHPNRSSLAVALAATQVALASHRISTPSLANRSGVIHGDHGKYENSPVVYIDGLSAAATPTSPEIHGLPPTIRNGAPVSRDQISTNRLEI